MKALFAFLILALAALPAEAGIVLQIKVPPKPHKLCTMVQGKQVCKWVKG